jgi:integrase
VRGQNRKFLPANFGSLARGERQHYTKPDASQTCSKETKGLRNRDGEWHYRIKYQGHEITGNTGLLATNANVPAALVARAQALLKYKQREPVIELMPVEMRIPEGVKLFNEWCKGEHQDKPNTWKWYKSCLASVEFYFGDRLFSSITNGDIENFKSWRRSETHVGSTAIRGNMIAMSALFKYGRKQRWLKHDPLEEVKVPAAKRISKMHIFTPAQEQKYVMLARKEESQDHGDIIEIMFPQGCRPEELMVLLQTEVDLQRRVFVVGKKTEASRRTLKMTKRTFEILSARLSKPGTWVFPSRTKKDSHLTTIQKAHEKVMLQLGFQAVPYDARHTFATRHAVNLKTPLPVLAALLGHSDMTKLRIYVHPDQDAMDAAMLASDVELGTLGT